MDKQLTLKKESIRQFRQIDDSEPEWFYRLRRDGWEIYRKSPAPNRASHLWRYSDPKNYSIDSPERFFGELPRIRNDNGHSENAASHDNTYQLSPELKERGIILKDLFSAIRINSALVEKHFGSLIGSGYGLFESLNMALWNDGYFLYIPNNVVLNEPIVIRNADGPIFRRSLIVVGENSQVTIMDDYESDVSDKGNISNSALELFVGDGSIVRYVNLQNVDKRISGYVNYSSKIGRDSQIQSVFGGFGGSNFKVNAGTILAGRGSRSRMDGIVFADEKQKFDFHTRHHHTASDSYSDLNFKVILKDKANSAYTGLIRIEEDALNCEAYQENRNLLLNPGTKAESIPELEILTDQVRCTHGATMGPIDPEMVFYLKSRGFSKSQATIAIVGGFVKSILDNLPDEVSESINNIVMSRLEGERNAV